MPPKPIKTYIKKNLYLTLFISSISYVLSSQHQFDQKEYQKEYIRIKNAGGDNWSNKMEPEDAESILNISFDNQETSEQRLKKAKQAYKKLSRMMHPDRQSNQPEGQKDKKTNSDKKPRENFSEKARYAMQKINKAIDVIKIAIKDGYYDSENILTRRQFEKIQRLIEEMQREEKERKRLIEKIQREEKERKRLIEKIQRKEEEYNRQKEEKQRKAKEKESNKKKNEKNKKWLKQLEEELDTQEGQWEEKLEVQERQWGEQEAQKKRKAKEREKEKKRKAKEREEERKKQYQRHTTMTNSFLDIMLTTCTIAFVVKVVNWLRTSSKKKKNSRRKNISNNKRNKKQKLQRPHINHTTNSKPHYHPHQASSTAIQ